MLAEALVLIVLPLLLIAAAGWDITSFTIPNFLTATLTVLFAVFAVSAGLSWATIGWHRARDTIVQIMAGRLAINRCGQRQNNFGHVRSGLGRQSVDE